MTFRAHAIDIAPYVEGGTDYARSRVATALDDELRASGFAQVVGHGIPASVIDGLGSAMDDLFGLDLATKLRWRHGESNRGYVPSRTETQTLSLGIPSPTGLADWVEGFDVGISPPDYPHVRVEGIPYAESVWPDVPEFRRRVDTYFSEAGRVVRELLGVLGDATHLGRTHFDAYNDHAVDTLGMNWYRTALATSAHDRGMSEHTDYGLLSLGWTDPGPGLEVLDPDGRWQPVEPSDGALIVFVGDLLAHLVGDRWSATAHRAMPSAGVEVRRSAFFFHDGNADALITPIARLGDPSTSRRDPVLVSEHIQARLAAGRHGTPYTGGRREADRIRRSLA